VGFFIFQEIKRMAIHIISGVPGAGKTYYAIHHLVTHHFEKKSGQYFLKPGRLLVSNIDNLHLDHVPLSHAMADKSVEQYFNVEYQKKIAQKHKQIVYLLDEAQQFFHRRFYDKDVFFYFQYHRHLGHDIYLITQNTRNLPQELQALCELEIYAVRRSLSIAGEFKYNVLSNREIVDHKLLRKKKEIFGLYTSFQNATAEKVVNPFRKYAVALLIFIAVVFIFFKRIIYAKFYTQKPEQKKHEKTTDISKHISHDIIPDDKYITIPIRNYIRVSGKVVKVYSPFNRCFISPADFPYPLYATENRVFFQIKKSVYDRVMSQQEKSDNT
jgi:zona occludens toxin (predicted ATPase)